MCVLECWSGTRGMESFEHGHDSFTCDVEVDVEDDRACDATAKSTWDGLFLSNIRYCNIFGIVTYSVL